MAGAVIYAHDCFFFFFQAEDGIRDVAVTGVQTCALPISTRSPSHTYSAGGTYSVKLTVTDNAGGTGTVTHSVTVSAPNQAPTVNAGANVTMGPGLFTLQASFSDPDGGGPWNYKIEWGDPTHILPTTSSVSDP